MTLGILEILLSFAVLPLAILGLLAVAATFLTMTGRGPM